MKITDIKRQKRNESCFSVYVDGKYSFTLTDLELSSSGLRAGQDLNADELAGWQKQSGSGRAFALALRYVGLRPRSRREVADYLWRKGFSQEESEFAQSRLVANGLLNDRDFAQVWVANRLALRPRSRRRLAQELAAKGVASDDLDIVLDELDQESELASLMVLVEKKRRLSQYAEAQKLKAYLGRQGYSYDLIKMALERLDND